jgi:signal transduction histidine kinase
MGEDALHKLRERVKELTALHKTARILQDPPNSLTELVRRVAELLPPAWQFPEITVARIRLGSVEAVTRGFRRTRWRLEAAFSAREDKDGEIEVCYLEERPPAEEGPFLKEERDLIDSLAEMLRSHFLRLLADQDLSSARLMLESTVAARTSELEAANAALGRKIIEYQKVQEQVRAHEQQLRKLASELCLAEARERKIIAEDLHDHLGQALAFVRMHVAQFRGNAIFCGFENTLDDVLALLDQAIRYTRGLTFEISPPSLYKLGLEAAIEALAERFRGKYGLAVDVEGQAPGGRLDEEVKVLLYKSVQELLTNVAKHAGAARSVVRICSEGELIRVEVEDDGRGFAVGTVDQAAIGDGFGLLSIRERVKYLGGKMEVRSLLGKGTSVVLLVPSSA